MPASRTDSPACCPPWGVTTAGAARHPEQTVDRLLLLARRYVALECDYAMELSERKRHLRVDTIGLVLRVLAHPADFQNRTGAHGFFWPSRTPCRA